MLQILEMSKRHIQGGRRLLLYPLWTAIIALGSGNAGMTGQLLILGWIATVAACTKVYFAVY
jgi:hypothetical protein